MRTLRQCLFDCDLALLRAIAAQWSIDLPSNRHDDALNLLSAHMADAAAHHEVWGALSPTEQEALAALKAVGGALPTGAFARRWGEIRPLGPGRLERERPWEAPASLAEALWYRGLIFKAFDQGPGGMQEVVFIPQELQAMIEAPDAQEHVTLNAITAPETVHPSSAQLVDDLCSLVAFVHATTIHTALDQPWPERHLQTLKRQLRDADTIRLDLLMHLAAHLALVKPDARPLRPDPQTATAWLQAPTLQQQRSLFEGWLNSGAWNDLWRVPTLRCEDTGSWHNDPLAARRAVLDVLVRLDTGGWYRLDDLIEHIRAASPDFQRPGGDYGIWYIRDAATNQYLKGFESWDKVEGALLRFIVAGPLHWLGMVDLDADRIAFCVTPVGRWLIAQGDAPMPSEETTFTVHLNGQVDVSAARRYDRFQLARVAEWVASGETYTYRVTPASLERARAQRIAPERIIEFLGRTSGMAVPESLAGALRRWGTRGTEAWAQEAIVLRVARPELLDELAESPRTRQYLRETVSSTVALVNRRDWPELLAALLEMGILPEVKAELGN